MQIKLRRRNELWSRQNLLIVLIITTIIRFHANLRRLRGCSLVDTNELTTQTSSTTSIQPYKSKTLKSYSFFGEVITDDEKDEVESTIPIPLTKKDLLFVHIPKNAGTSIEKTAASEGLNWGYCLFESNKKKKKKARSNNPSICPTENELSTIIHEKPLETNSPYWHYPVQYLPKNIQRLYKSATLFAVVRNPYERFISEYYYICSVYKNVFRACHADPNDATLLNQVLVKQFNKVKQCKRKNTECYYMMGGHFIPQYDFIFDAYGNRMVDHVLHFENIEEEFDELMSENNYEDMDLSKKENQRKVRTKKSVLDVDDLDKSTVELINELYSEDFGIGNYRMMK